MRFQDNVPPPPAPRRATPAVAHPAWAGVGVALVAGVVILTIAGHLGMAITLCVFLMLAMAGDSL